VVDPKATFGLLGSGRSTLQFEGARFSSLGQAVAAGITEQPAVPLPEAA
jgi:hypothetical protein